jgi:hypothetical protein
MRLRPFALDDLGEETAWAATDATCSQRRKELGSVGGLDAAGVRAGHVDLNDTGWSGGGTR